MKKDVNVFLGHILEAIVDIESFIRNVKKETFLKNKEKQNAVVRSLEVIGEAVKNIPDDFRKKNNNIPWKEIVGMRDKIMMNYFGIDLELIWKTIKRDIPELKKELGKYEI